MAKLMRIPTNREWDKLVEATGGDNEKMHWEKMYSHVSDSENEYHMPAAFRANHGYRAARHWSNDLASNRCAGLGFRPTIAGLPRDTLPSEGTMRIIGTLYMDGKPVKVPQNPVWDGDIVDYIPGAKLEMREALDDPAYQVTGIYLDDGLFIADRALLKNISYEDIEQTLTTMPQVSQQKDDEFDWLLKTAREGDYEESVIRHQLRALWTAYCMHKGLDVDTCAYGERLREVYGMIASTSMKGKRFDHEAFDLFMGEYLC